MRATSKKFLSEILKAESKLVLSKYKPKVITITGSVGKTSTKDAVFAVISKMAYVRKSEKSYNSELGLPLTILGCPNGWNNFFVWFLNIIKSLWLVIWTHKYPKWLVLEVGVGKPGDMKKTAMWLKSDAVILTAIGDTPAHIEFFESKKHLMEEKAGLLKTLKKNGVLILNADDSGVLEMGAKSKNRKVTFGFSPEADIVASGENISYNADGVPEGIIFRVDAGGVSLPVAIEGVFGRNHVYASLAALALSSSLKLNMLEAVEALKNYDVPPGRMRLLSGINGSFIIDDTYNASPFASVSALETLGGVKCKGRRIVVFGDMLELGKHTMEAHTEIGKITKEKADILIVVGARAKSVKDGALEAGMKEKNIFEFANSREAGEFLKDFVGAGDLVLLKGSQGMRMERAVEAILLDQKNKKNLLVRQDKEWLAKE